MSETVRARSYYNGNDIIFIILVLSNVDITMGIVALNGGVHMAMHDFKAQNCRCRHSVNKA